MSGLIVLLVCITYTFPVVGSQKLEICNTVRKLMPVLLENLSQFFFTWALCLSLQIYFTAVHNLMKVKKKNFHKGVESLTCEV